MKKFIVLLLFLIPNCFAMAELKDVGIAKYAVIEVLKDNTPIRTQDNENARRITHLFKDTVLFADKETKDYYRVELKEGFFGFINKKHVEVQAIIPEKRFDEIKKVQFLSDSKTYKVKIETETNSAFMVDEKDKSLDFTMFDNHFDPTELNIKNKFDNFKITDKISNELNIKYDSRRNIFGYSVEKSDKGYIYTIKKPPLINRKKPLKKLTLVVDPGHGGPEKGACANNLEEKDLNLQISKKLKKELTKRGAKVYLTRSKDKKIDLYDRIDFAKEKEADILLSIHQNSLANPKDYEKKHGVGTYYYRNQAKPLAEAIQKELLATTKFNDDKVNYRSFALTRPTEFVSVLIECGYIIHPYEAKKLSDKKFQKEVAKAIVKGCENYLDECF